MSPRKKAGEKAGTLHRKTRQQPIRQGDAGKDADDSVPAKPDFDDKERGISPRRKPPGPAKRRRRSSLVAPATAKTSVRPEARITSDDDDSK